MLRDYRSDSKKVFTGFYQRYYEKILPIYEKLPKPKNDPYTLPQLLKSNGKPNEGLGIYGTLTTLNILHREDKIFLYKQKHEYLSYLKNPQGEPNWDTNNNFEKLYTVL